MADLWHHPAFLAAALLGCVLVIWALLRAGGARRTAEFSCDLCGRKQHGFSAREWRYCPYCGTPAKRDKPIY